MLRLWPGYEMCLVMETLAWSQTDCNISKPCLVETKLYIVKSCTRVFLSSLWPRFPFISTFGSTDPLKARDGDRVKTTVQSLRQCMGFRSRHEGLLVPSNSLTLLFSTRPLCPAFTKPGRLSSSTSREALTKRNQEGVSSSAHQQYPQSQPISTSAVICPIHCT